MPAEVRTEAVSRGRLEALPVPREQRYPLDLAVRIPEMRQLYRESNASIWDVARDLDTSSMVIDSIDTKVLAAAALTWSRRCWIQFADISESEAALVRSCIERDRAADLKYVLAARATERAVAVDACHRIAVQFGGYVSEPRSEELRALFATDIIRRALDTRVDFDAFFVAHFVVIASLDLAMLECSIRHTTEPVCLSALDRIARDARRQEAAGRLYLAARLTDLNADDRRAIADNAAAVVKSEVLSGVRCTTLLANDVPGAAELIDAESRTASGGLGSAPLGEQRAAIVTALETLDAELAQLGIETALAQQLPEPTG